MSLPAHRRHDISEAVWRLLEPHLPGRAGAWGGKARDNRLFINAVCWILRTGAPWRDLPPDQGDWKHTHRRFCRWRDRGIWEGLLAQWVTEPDFEWLMIDASHIKVRPVLKAAIRTWAAPKGAQHEAAFGRGCAWYADPSIYYIRRHSRLCTG
jgi:transposase